jgi:D-xylose transport system ATP-binding protein
MEAVTDEVTRLLEDFQLGEAGRRLYSFLISHDIHDVFDLADRVCVMKNGQVVGTARTGDVTKDEVLGMIILGKCPPGAVPGPGAMQAAAA